VWRDEAAHFVLLPEDGTRGVDNGEAEFVHHAVVFFEDLSLEDFEALFAVVGELTVHSGFVKFEFRASGENSFQRHFERRTEEKANRRLDGKPINLANPFRIASADDIASEGGVNVAIGEDYRAGFERRDDVALGSVGKIGRMEKGKRRRSEERFFLRSFRRLHDERRGIPLGENDGIAFALQPLVEQGELSGFATAVRAFDDEQPSGKIVITVRSHNVIAFDEQKRGMITSICKLLDIK